ncbi:hypothetical protein ACIRRI_54895, partial [Streptomyces mirabilis]
RGGRTRSRGHPIRPLTSTNLSTIKNYSCRVSPTLFDAPSRAERDPLTWTAHSYLAWTPMDDTERRVLPLAGFSWGFNIDSASRITLQQVQTLTAVDWDTHLPYLDTSHPGWVFDNW